MSPIDPLLIFLAFYPVVTGAAWMIGGVLFRILEERPRLTDPPGGWPGVTVLVPAYNEEKVIAGCVRALRRVDYPHLEILILNDGSRDGTVAAARAAAEGDERVTVLDDGVNRGKADRLNDGMRRARHGLVLVTDADTHLHADAVTHLVRRMLRSPRYAAIAGCPRVTNRGSVLATLQMLETASLIGLIRRTHALAGRVGTVAGVLGLFRRDAVLAVGGYDPAMATEDIELTWRLLEAGHLTGFAPMPSSACRSPRPSPASGPSAPAGPRAGRGPAHARADRAPAEERGHVAHRRRSAALLPVGRVHADRHRLRLHPLDPRPGGRAIRRHAGLGVGIAVIAMIQIVVAVLVDLRLDPRLPYACLLMPLYPLAYWTLNALAALSFQTRGLVRGPRRRRVVWDLPAAISETSPGLLAPSSGRRRRRLPLGRRPRTSRSRPRGRPDTALMCRFRNRTRNRTRSVRSRAVQPGHVTLRWE